MDKGIARSSDWAFDAYHWERFIYENEWNVLQCDTIDSHMSMHFLSGLCTTRLSCTDRSEWTDILMSMRCAESMEVPALHRTLEAFSFRDRRDRYFFHVIEKIERDRVTFCERSHRTRKRDFPKGRILSIFHSDDESFVAILLDGLDLSDRQSRDFDECHGDILALMDHSSHFEFFSENSRHKRERYENERFSYIIRGAKIIRQHHSGKGIF